MNLSAPSWAWARSSMESWLAAPAHPVWPVSNTDASFDVVANGLDSQGWLIAARGWGVARYELPLDLEGHRRRMRSWQLGAISTNCDLDLAIITSNVVWVSERMEGCVPWSVEHWRRCLRPTPTRRGSLVSTPIISAIGPCSGCRRQSLASQPTPTGLEWSVVGQSRRVGRSKFRS